MLGIAFVVLLIATVGALAALMVELGGEPGRGEPGDGPGATPGPSPWRRVAARAAQIRRRSSRD